MVSRAMIPFRTGNLGVERLAAARAGRPAPDPDAERRLLPAWRATGFDAVEDYVFRELVEPARGRHDWSVHRGNAHAARAAGLSYWIYPWAHAAPAWFRASRDFVPGRCLEHGEPGPMMSPFAASTRQASLDFLRAVRAGLGDVVDGLAVAFPADYGEVGFLSGVAGWLLGAGRHHHTGLWCDEREARLAFARQARDRHGTPGRLGAAWGMDGALAWERCPYPYGAQGRDGVPGEPTPAHRLDFARCYQGAVTDLTRTLLEAAAGLFPGVPRELKLGHCSETLELGTDWHALVAAAAATDATVRFTGAGMGEVFTRRLASLCRGHGVPFATEAPREVDARHLVERLFTDLAAGTTSFFEYPEQMEAVRAPLAALRPALGRRPLLPAVAIAYPTTELRLAPGHGAPTDTVHCWDAFRRVCDLHPLDERQIARGALREHAALVWLEDARVPGGTLAALEAWVRAGGVLITGCATGPAALVDAAGGAGDDGGAGDAGGVSGAGGARGADAPHAALLDAMHLAPVRYLAGAAAPEPVVHPGEAGARLLLAGDWHGRDDGAWAWRAATPPVGGAAPALPCRWTGARATLHVPRRTREAGGADALDLVIDAWAPYDAAPLAVRVSLDGAAAGTLSLHGAAQARLALPAADGTADAVARVTLELAARRPSGGGPHADRRVLGLLVRRVAVVARGAALPEPHAPRTRFAGGPGGADGGAGCATEPPDVRAEGARRALGAGCVLPGDGTPLSALAWLRLWLDEAPQQVVASGRLAGDASMRCLVTALDGGLLVHNPDASAAARPDLQGHGADWTAGIDGQVPPLGTRWLTVPPARAPPGRHQLP
jgi:hypothetical protein